MRRAYIMEYANPQGSKAYSKYHLQVPEREERNTMETNYNDVIRFNCTSSDAAINRAISARKKALATAAIEGVSDLEISLANAEANKAERNLHYKAVATVVIIENGSKEALRQRGTCAEAQRNLAKVFAKASPAVKNAVHLDKVATAAYMATAVGDVDDIITAEDEADKALAAHAEAYQALTAKEKAIYAEVIAAKTACNEVLASTKTSFLPKVGLDLGEPTKGFVEAKILGIEPKAASIGTKVTVTYRKVNGRIRDIRIA